MGRGSGSESSAGEDTRCLAVTTVVVGRKDVKKERRSSGRRRRTAVFVSACEREKLRRRRRREGEEEEEEERTASAARTQTPTPGHSLTASEWNGEEKAKVERERVLPADGVVLFRRQRSGKRESERTSDRACIRGEQSINSAASLLQQQPQQPSSPTAPSSPFGHRLHAQNSAPQPVSVCRCDRLTVSAFALPAACRSSPAALLSFLVFGEFYSRLHRPSLPLTPSRRRRLLSRCHHLTPGPGLPPSLCHPLIR